VIKYLTLVVALVACNHKKEPAPRDKPAGSGSGSASVADAATPPDAASKPVTYDALPRADFNRWAVRENLPVYWIADANKDGKLEPDEVASLLFYPTQAVWVSGGAFTPAFEAAYGQIVAASKQPVDTKTDDGKRQELVGKDLDQGRATLVRTDFTQLSADDKAFVGHMLKVAELIDRVYADQDGSSALADKIAPDAASHSLFRRDHGPKCVAPLTENQPLCSAIPNNPKPVVTVYPAKLTGKNGPVDQSQKEFCEIVEKAKNADKLTNPFTVVKDDLTAVPYTDVYKDQMAAVSDELTAAAASVKDPAEKPLVTYLTAAAASFKSNDWLPSDEAWAKMTVQNSKWYVRAGADETYWEPCAHKAGFHLTFARINQGSIEWQNKLAPIQQEMEAAIAAKSGPPYAARKVTFHLPDFIDIVVNAGDDRNPLGATIGESLPNWGPVAAEGRGRTVAMVNLYGDPDSRDARRQQAESLFDAETAKLYAGTQEPGLLATILHEATHNLGPANEYKIGSKKADDIFGGPIASMLEELKAQTGALFLLDMLRTKKLVSDELAVQSFTDDIVWAFGHISQGMYTGTGARKAYGNLAAIQIGLLVDKGALTWDPKATAANGKDKGAFHLHPDKLVAVADDMMKLVGGIKARGDVKAVNELIKKYVDAETVVPHKVISERLLRFPKASFVYAVSL
jgi:hypothetical protein